MAAGLRLWLLGGFRAEVGGQAVPERRWHRRKACSLVKLLALEPRHRLHREQLIVGRSAAPARIGVHTGEVVGQPLPALAGVSGSALIIARRLAEAAKPGTVLVSERTYRSARTQFVFAGPVSVAGPPGEPAVRARRMLSRHHAVPEWDVPGESPFVGRRFDLDAIAALFEDVVATGQPRMVTVVGPAGIGKSRLVREAITAVSRSHPSARILTGRCIAAERGMTWWPLAELLHQLCRISLEDSAETAGAKLREGLTSILIRAGFAEGELDPIVFALAATAAIAVPGNPLDRSEPTLVADELGRTWPRFLSACSASAPTLIVIEDLHWAGQQMLEMVERLATRGDGSCLLVGTTRPELLESRRGFGAGIEGFSTISLRALSDADSATLLRQLPVAQQIPDQIAGEILARSEGNPFFIEQLAFHLAHDPGNSLPDALYAVLAARIDALPVPERRVLQEAAVFGRVFWAAALSNAVPGIDVLAELRRRPPDSCSIENHHQRGLRDRIGACPAVPCSRPRRRCSPADACHLADARCAVPPRALGRDVPDRGGTYGGLRAGAGGGVSIRPRRPSDRSQRARAHG
jgi:AAA ATPase-like protein